MSHSATPSSDSSANLIEEIDAKIGEVRTEAIDLSFGEILNLKGTNEVVIDPEYQRLFRWSDEQKSRLIESVLLRLPIPPVFFIENTDGTLELIDGLQRVSTMMQFVEPSLIGLDALSLSGCDIVLGLNGLSYDDLPLTLKLQVKRSTVRAVVIKRQSKSFLRYEMFKRLNTGGSLLSPQELRNCSARLFGEWGVDFYRFLVRLSNHPSFLYTTDNLAEAELEKRGREELVLRFFAAKDGANVYSGHVADWLDGYMERVLQKQMPFDVKSQEVSFKRVFDCIAQALGEHAFCKYQNDHAVGGLAPAHYEAVSMAFCSKIDLCEKADRARLLKAVSDVKQSTTFRQNVGTGANNKTKLRGRVGAVEAAIEGLSSVP